MAKVELIDPQELFLPASARILLLAKLNQPTSDGPGACRGRYAHGVTPIRSRNKRGDPTAERN